MREASTKTVLWVRVCLLLVGAYVVNLATLSLTDGWARMGSPGWSDDEWVQNQMLLVFLGLPLALPATLFLLFTWVSAVTGRHPILGLPFDAGNRRDLP